MSTSPEKSGAAGSLGDRRAPGGYREGASAVHRLDPRTKLLALLLVSLASMLLTSAPALGALAGFLLASHLVAGIPPGRTLGSLGGFFWFFLFTLLAQTLWARGTVIAGFTFGGISLSLTNEGLKQAGQVFLRLVILVLGAQLLSATTTPGRLGSGLGRLLSPFRRMGLPVEDTVLAFSIGLQFLPILRREADDIRKAQVSRGIGHFHANPLKRLMALRALFVPVIVRALRRSEDLSLAMVLRGYREGGCRTSLYPLAFGSLDLAALVVVASALLAAFRLG